MTSSMKNDYYISTLIKYNLRSSFFLHPLHNIDSSYKVIKQDTYYINIRGINQNDYE